MDIGEFLQKDIRAYLEDIKTYGHPQQSGSQAAPGTDDLLAPKTPDELKKEKLAKTAQAQGATAVQMGTVQTSTPTQIKAEKVIVQEENKIQAPPTPTEVSIDKTKETKETKQPEIKEKDSIGDILPPPPPKPKASSTPPTPVNLNITEKVAPPPLPKFEDDESQKRENDIIAAVASEAAAKTAARLEEKRRIEEEARKKAEEEAKKKAEEEARKKAEEEKRKAQEEKKRQEEEARKKAQEEKRKAELERIKKIEDEKQRKILEEKMRVEEARRRVLEEKKRQEAEQEERERKEREAREAQERKQRVLAEKKRKEEERKNNLKKHEEPLIEKLRKEEQGLKEAFQLEDYNAAVRHYRRLKRDAPTLHYHEREQQRIYEQLKELAPRIPSLQIVELREEDLSLSLPKPKDKSTVAPKPISGDFHHLYLQAVKAIDEGDKRKALQLLIALAKDKPNNLAVKIHLKEALAL